MNLARAERADFADLLAGLTGEQWDAASLCVGWNVRDVVAHAFSFEELNTTQTVGRFARGILTFRDINAIGLQEMADRTPTQLVELVRRSISPRGLTTGFGGLIALSDGMIHQQDIRRPLGLPRVIPAERLRTVLDFARWAPPLRGGWRARGVRLAATDIDWTSGRGPEVTGPGEALLMAMAGRPDALNDLEGPGKPILVQRIS